MDLCLAAALVLGKLVHKATRRLGLGGGTAIPGLVAAAVDPALLTKLSGALTHGSVIITGTNGKTTTARLLADMLRGAHHVPIHNRSGSNMIRGMASAMVVAAGVRGDLRADVGVWEVDEATLPDAITALRPRLVLINNLFRDQLDRYGEVNTVAAIWAKSLRLLPADCIVVLNADDPRVAHLGTATTNRVFYFGLDDLSCALPRVPEAADSIHCVVCAHPLTYEAVFLSHMGRYRCPACGLQRPQPIVKVTQVERTGPTGTSIRVVTPQGELAITVSLPGLYNIYNALAATTAALALGLSPEVIRDAIGQLRAAFGRQERLTVGDKQLVLLLVKNPAGFNEVLRTIFAEDGHCHVLILINDLLADGTDVSWLWDVDFEQMQGKVAHAVVSGIRAVDMALRLKYADVKPRTGDILVEPVIARALTAALEAMPDGETLYVLPTYTAMLAIKDELARRGLAPSWHDD